MMRTDDGSPVGRFLGRRIWGCRASRPAAESLALSLSVAGGRHVIAVVVVCVEVEYAAWSAPALMSTATEN